jgi:hypothetical protein
MITLLGYLQESGALGIVCHCRVAAAGMLSCRRTYLCTRVARKRRPLIASEASWLRLNSPSRWPPCLACIVLLLCCVLAGWSDTCRGCDSRCLIAHCLLGADCIGRRCYCGLLRVLPSGPNQISAALFQANRILAALFQGKSNFSCTLPHCGCGSASAAAPHHHSCDHGHHSCHP